MTAIATSTGDEEARWAAVLARDPDARFVYAVRTSGIYCRPTCPSRRPKRENVAFYEGSAAAEAAGFRPCKRCRPEQGDPGRESGHEPGRESAVETDWRRIGAELDERGYGLLPGLLETAECRALAAHYGEAERFRRRVVMARHGYGRGEYRYFAYPLPARVAGLRSALYPPLAALANRWERALGREGRFPEDHEAYLARCRAAGQSRPTPLLLRYGAGDYNCLHQDLYGEEVFPLQVAVLLSAPGRDFSGGEFVLTEQRMRRQSRVEVVPLGQGDAVVFPVRERPVASQRGFARANMRHGVSRLTGGERYTLGIIFHDAA